MSTLPAVSSLMPTIKCSSCGRQVEISMMGEHVCQGAPASELSPNSDSFAPFMPFNKAIHEKISPLPPVDTATANRSYLRQGQLTPASLSSGSRSVSPKTPNARPAAGRADEYFAPKIANEYGSTSPQQSRRQDGYGGFGDVEGDGTDQAYQAGNPNKQPLSLLTRMNTVAPGPFETGRRPSTRNISPIDGANGFSRSPSGNDRPGTGYDWTGAHDRRQGTATLSSHNTRYFAAASTSKKPHPTSNCRPRWIQSVNDQLGR
ncbi:hypothetical protein NKR23_g1503 [Pleurostoma richardsiae]|uniref:Uncharacterized protein n=1 Tax=Pleurostoma richardsiae TaxID=41990 RepID=A0AA38S554_9PEZI|nr:hypothetical protein NKR23_g1503 [Pleurostoma richardsiae]